MRICRNPTPVLFEEEAPLEIGRIRKMRDGTGLTIGACGVPLSMAAQASEALADEGIEVDLLDISTIKPLDVETLVASASKTGKMLTVEEHNVFGGMGEAVAHVLAKHCPTRMDSVAIEDTFAESGDYDAPHGQIRPVRRPDCREGEEVAGLVATRDTGDTTK